MATQIFGSRGGGFSAPSILWVLRVWVSALPGTLEFLTDFGLPAQGSVAWFKVYVVTTTSNEKGSNAVKVVRP